VNLQAIIAIAAAQGLDLWRRPSTRLLAAAGAAAILSLRWFSAFGLGYELVQLQELGVYTLGLCAALAVLMICLPRDNESGSDETAILLTRPVSALSLSLGAYLGRLAAVSALCVVWGLSMALAIWWFSLSEPRLFSYNGADSALEESLRLILPCLGQWLVAAVLLALVQPVSRSGRPGVTAVALIVVYVVGFSSGSLGILSSLLPDFQRLDLTGGLWGGDRGIDGFWLAPHALLWCIVGLSIDTGTLRMLRA